MPTPITWQPPEVNQGRGFMLDGAGGQVYKRTVVCPAVAGLVFDR